MIARIRNHLSNQQGRKGKLEASTIKSYFDKFKVVLTYAAKKDHLLDQQALEQCFEDITISVPKKKEGQHLEIDEIQSLRKLVFDKKDQSLERDRDLFLFQVYTGFYYNDLQILKKRQLFRDIEWGRKLNLATCISYQLVLNTFKFNSPNSSPYFVESQTGP